jgi:hypothetical protein
MGEAAVNKVLRVRMQLINRLLRSNPRGSVSARTGSGLDVFLAGAADAVTAQVAKTRALIEEIVNTLREEDAAPWQLWQMKAWSTEAEISRDQAQEELNKLKSLKSQLRNLHDASLTKWVSAILPSWAEELSDYLCKENERLRSQRDEFQAEGKKLYDQRAGEQQQLQQPQYPAWSQYPAPSAYPGPAPYAGPPPAYPGHQAFSGPSGPNPSHVDNSQFSQQDDKAQFWNSKQ